MESNNNFLGIMQDYLEKIGKLTSPTQVKLDRSTGKPITLSMHVKYMIHALLSNQENWNNLLKYLPEIDEIFSNYEIKKIKEKPWEYFYEKIRLFPIRGLSLKKQLKSLKINIEIMETINNENAGDIDAYILSKSPREITVNFIKKHKLPNMGVSLICEYLKNVGVECIKPDTHIMRFLSKTRRGYLSKGEAYIAKNGKKKAEKVETIWTDNDKLNVLEIVENIGNLCGKTSSDIDRIIWSYCADGQAEICTKKPKCNICVVRDGCNRDKPGVKF